MSDTHRDILHLARVWVLDLLCIKIVTLKLISFFRKLFNNSRNVLFFIHFNLAVSLLIAILVFVLGIETASGNAVSSNPRLSLSLPSLHLLSLILWYHIKINYPRLVVRLWQHYYTTYSSLPFVGCSVRESCFIYCFTSCSVTWPRSGGPSFSLDTVSTVL